MSPAFQTYSDDLIDQAIRNYSKAAQEEYNISDRPVTFVNFIIRWVERFTDEAKPFDKYQKRGGEDP
ncbi:MAG: hypothetical protein LBD29_03635, partial [Treponema sp.]|nr:hypothetical protein [Treponema sp.]